MEPSGLFLSWKQWTYTYIHMFSFTHSWQAFSINMPSLLHCHIFLFSPNIKIIHMLLTRGFLLHSEDKSWLKTETVRKKPLAPRVRYTAHVKRLVLLVLKTVTKLCKDFHLLFLWYNYSERLIHDADTTCITNGSLNPTAYSSYIHLFTYKYLYNKHSCSLWRPHRGDLVVGSADIVHAGLISS